MSFQTLTGLSVCIEVLTKHSRARQSLFYTGKTGFLSLSVLGVSDTTTFRAVRDGPCLSLSDFFFTSSGHTKCDDSIRFIFLTDFPFMDFVQS